MANASPLPLLFPPRRLRIVARMHEDDDMLIRGIALAMRDLSEQCGFDRLTGRYPTGQKITYRQGKGIQVKAGDRVLDVPEAALDDHGLVAASDVEVMQAHLRHKEERPR